MKCVGLQCIVIILNCVIYICSALLHFIVTGNIWTESGICNALLLVMRVFCVTSRNSETETFYFYVYTLCLKKGYHPTTNDNFNNSCRILVIFGTNITE